MTRPESRLSAGANWKPEGDAWTATDWLCCGLCGGAVAYLGWLAVCVGQAIIDAKFY